jgi:membrane protein
MALVVSGIFSLLYYATPNVRQPRFRWFTPGGFSL